MSVEENKALVHRIYQAFNGRDLDQLHDLLAGEFVDHTAGPGQRPGVEGIRQAWRQLYAAFPDVRFVVEEMLAEEDKVATRGTFRGIPPKDKRMMEFVRIQGGRVVELWNMIS